MHVAALPFPSSQGTQAALRTMLDACASVAGADVHLLVYPGGARALEDTRFTLHRVPRAWSVRDGPRALRSGPSVGKVVLDVGLAREVRRLVERLQPDVVVAHHVEACAAALLARAAPLVFVAHTELGPELPAYLPTAFARFFTPALTRAGAELDALLVRRADGVAAVCPALAARLTTSTGREVHTLALPWPVPPSIGAEERADARAQLGFAESDQVVVYAGNFDRYQGLPLALAALGTAAPRVPRLRLLVASDSPSGELEPLLRAAGIAGCAVFAPLAGDSPELSRRRVHAAADVALIPRAIEGGVSVKLLDALARGVPVVAQRRALGGLSLAGAASVCTDDDAEALAVALAAVLAAPQAARAAAERGRAHVTRAHSESEFLHTLAEVTEAARGHRRRP